MSLSLRGSERTTYNYRLGATLLQGTHTANLPLLAGAYPYGIPYLSKNMQKAVKSL